jgi:drug/metabolite transporter (DMT)-like permease
VNYIAVAFGVLFGIAFFDTVPGLLSVAGIVLILTGLSMLRTRSNSRQSQ